MVVQHVLETLEVGFGIAVLGVAFQFFYGAGDGGLIFPLPIDGAFLRCGCDKQLYCALNRQRKHRQRHHDADQYPSGCFFIEL